MRKKSHVPNLTERVGKTRQRDETHCWRVAIGRIAIPIVTLSAAAVLLAYKDELTHIARPWMSNAAARIEDFIRPMPDGKIIGISLNFSIPPDIGAQYSEEDLGITLYPEQCKQAGGFAIVRVVANEEPQWATRAIVRVTCRASGETTVTLTPRNGSTATVFEGIPSQWEEHPFPGVTGSYTYGKVIAMMFEPKLPEGPRVPVNKCQQTDDCPR